MEKVNNKASNTENKFKKILKVMGPGIITGAADDDPSGIATYAQTGTQFGYGLLWTTLYLLPLMIATQEACARIGAVTEKGLMGVIKINYSKKIVYITVILILIANTINIGADLGAMAEATKLIIPLRFAFLVILYTIIILILEIFTSYKVYSRILKWLSLALLAYPITVFIINEPWTTLIKATLIPHFEFSFTFLFIITAVLGTTISPYMFFWETSEEVEQEKEIRIRKIKGKPKITKEFMHNLRLDNFSGMVASEFTTWCIIVVAATVLNAHNITTINTAADAAKALEPLVHTFPNSGFWAEMIFAIGIIGLGLLSVPVLSGSASYAVSEAFNWKEGLNLKLKRAHGFYGVIIIATFIGLLINFLGINPIKALVYTAVINGIVAVPLIFLIERVSQNEKIMGKYKSGRLSKTLLWITFFGMGAAAVSLFISLGH